MTVCGDPGLLLLHEAFKTFNGTSKRTRVVVSNGALLVSAATLCLLCQLLAFMIILIDVLHAEALGQDTVESKAELVGLQAQLQAKGVYG